MIFDSARFRKCMVLATGGATEVERLAHAHARIGFKTPASSVRSGAAETMGASL